MFILVLDGLGVGALPDAYLYGDEGSNTLGSILAHDPTIKLPALFSLGLGELLKSRQMDVNILGAYGKMAQLSEGKDTISGHWEIAGLPLRQAFPVYPDGFPPGVIHPFEALVGKKVLGNVAASGTEIIAELGEEHLETGRPIVYTSADSVFQVAAHEDIVPLQELQEWCLRAREEILQGEHAVGRVIARPFRGRAGNFQRTGNRRDYTLPPPGATLLDLVSGAGKDVWAIGKVKDVFPGPGITRHFAATGNEEIRQRLHSCVEMPCRGLIWATFVDFDMLYGHRNDVPGFAGALQAFDRFLQDFITRLRREDLLFITADHGCDPGFPGTDHTREYVPLLVYGEEITPLELGTRRSFADLGATVAEILGCSNDLQGTSFARLLLEGKFNRCKHWI